MKFKENIHNFIKNHISIHRLLMVIMALVILYLFALTNDFWSFAFSKVKYIMMPFVIGFTIAYILHPITKKFERIGIKKQISVPITLVLFVLVFILLFSSLIPKLATDFTTVIDSGVGGIRKVYDYYLAVSNGSPEPWINDVLNEILKLARGLIENIPTLPMVATQIIERLMNALTTALFSLVIGLYLIFDYEAVTHKILRGANYISPKLSNSLIVMNRAVLQYLQSLIIIMIVTFLEYSLLYTLIGHNYALILGVMAAIALLIPYIGAISVQVLAVLTGFLILPMHKVLILTVGLVILSNIDNYVIQPFIYQKRDKIDPISSLFVFFASSTLFGFVGILLSMPIYFAGRSVFFLRKNNWELETKVDKDEKPTITQ